MRYSNVKFIEPSASAADALTVRQASEMASWAPGTRRRLRQVWMGAVCAVFLGMMGSPLADHHGGHVSVCERMRFLRGGRQLCWRVFRLHGVVHGDVQPWRHASRMRLPGGVQLQPLGHGRRRILHVPTFRLWLFTRIWVHVSRCIELRCVGVGGRRVMPIRPQQHRLSRRRGRRQHGGGERHPDPSWPVWRRPRLRPCDGALRLGVLGKAQAVVAYSHESSRFLCRVLERDDLGPS